MAAVTRQIVLTFLVALGVVTGGFLGEGNYTGAAIAMAVAFGAAYIVRVWLEDNAAARAEQQDRVTSLHR